MNDTAQSAAEHARIEKIRKAEEQSHLKIYSEHALFASGSWLEHPVKSVMDLLSYFQGYHSLRVLDLGCGVGRNSIPIAKAFSHIPCMIDCVDIMPYAIKKLKENALVYGVEHSVCGFVSSIEEYKILPDTYDFAIAVSALEHICSRDALVLKLQELCQGIRRGGVVCMIISTDITEQDCQSGSVLQPGFEINLSADGLDEIIKTVFCDFDFLKQTRVQQQYVIPRENGDALLGSRVCTYAIKKRGN